jgi:hypothetical protein
MYTREGTKMAKYLATVLVLLSVVGTLQNKAGASVPEATKKAIKDPIK